MFRHGDQNAFEKFRFAIAGLLLLSVLTLGITVWFVIDFSREKAIVQMLIRDLPSSDLADAQELAGELRWQSRLTFLIILQVVATALAVVVLWRAYQTSQGSLRDVKAFAADVLSSMDQAVITVDRDTLITSFNPRTTELLRVSHDPFGHPLRELTDQLDLEQFCRSSQAAGDAPHQRDFQIHANDRPVWLRAYGQPLRDAEGAIIGHVIQLRDVTSQQHVQEQLRRMERFMGLGALAAGLHHEIKNPLAAVSLSPKGRGGARFVGDRVFPGGARGSQVCGGSRSPWRGEGGARFEGGRLVQVAGGLVFLLPSLLCVALIRMGR